jgi:hypothetical protein
MKKIILTGLVVMCVCLTVAYAQNEDQNPDEAIAVKKKDAVEPVKKIPAEKTAVRKREEREVAAASHAAVPIRKQNSAKSPEEQLIDLDMERSMGRIDELERRISAQDREMRSMSDNIRSLSRDVDDLKRRMR